MTGRRGRTGVERYGRPLPDDVQIAMCRGVGRVGFVRVGRPRRPRRRPTVRRGMMRPGRVVM